MARIEISRVIKADRDSVWNKLKDMEGWSKWGDANATYRVTEHSIIEQTDDIIICKEKEKFGLFEFQHTDLYRLFPKYKIEEKILCGDFSGTFEINLTDNTDGTHALVKVNIEPTDKFFKLLDKYFGDSSLHRFWESLLDQLCAEVEKRS